MSDRPSQNAPLSHPKSHAGDRPFSPKVRPYPIPNLTRAIALSVQSAIVRLPSQISKIDFFLFTRKHSLC
ncbi:MAG: hypothetical protein ACMG55_13970 [Microcoleus sp.]